MDLWGVLLGGAVALGGVLVTSFVAYKSAQLQAKAALNLDSAKRRDDRLLKRESIQQDTLLDLQGALREWMRAVALSSMADMRSLAEVGELGALPGEVDTATLEAGIRLLYLTERVIDDDLRAALVELRETDGAIQAERARDPAGVTIALVERDSRELMLRTAAVQEQLGKVLRVYLRGRD